MRRFIREGYVRYAFTRFGVPYVVSIQCLDSAPRPRRLACREAYPVAERFLKALRIAGGLPTRPHPTLRPEVGSRPAERLTRFHLPAVGVITSSGCPQAKWPRRPQRLFADPLSAGSAGFGPFAMVGSPAAATMSTAPAPLPWRDSFCEARSFNVGQCPSGFGHQGQDLRPGACPDPGRPETCDPKQQPIFAVRDGVLIRTPGQQAATLQINAQRTHSLPLYAHEPGQHGRRRRVERPRVAEGEKIGVVSNFSTTPTAPRVICISTCRCSRATGGSGSIPM